MRHLLILFAFVVLAAPVSAETQPAAQPHTDIVITVNGMVCDFCAQSVWKVLKEHEQVEDIDIDMDTGKVTVHLAPGTDMSDETVQEAITYSGYDFVSLERVEHNS